MPGNCLCRRCCRGDGQQPENHGGQPQQCALVDGVGISDGRRIGRVLEKGDSLDSQPTTDGDGDRQQRPGHSGESSSVIGNDREDRPECQSGKRRGQEQPGALPVAAHQWFFFVTVRMPSGFAGNLTGGAVGFFDRNGSVDVRFTQHECNSAGKDACDQTSQQTTNEKLREIVG